MVGEGIFVNGKLSKATTLNTSMSSGTVLVLAVVAAFMVVMPLILPPLPPPPLLLLFFPVGIMVALMFLAFSPAEGVLNTVV
ncbi:hypothetical protein CDL15_Pgr016182 [Punica granatum]|uniref:Uncharacterized protein n=1 Tax=Punica granatum TaxID=22663 RepID=A0A218X0X4_PUNGR|nr:hypothetical protein CDL15_Pgr016182 [Punica granatum]PKI68704.1 hypothetical protein CRG98_010761 [Punica granatum]